jgi:hypothetical protein
MHGSATEWIKRAVCAIECIDPDVFFPEVAPQPGETCPEACLRCPVWQECGQYGRNSHSSGWWGRAYLPW